MTKKTPQKASSRALYSKPEMRLLGSYIKLTQVERTGPRFDGGPPGFAGTGAPGQVGQLS